MRAWLESTAGIDDAPGKVSPSASTAAVIVDAVPIVMQWPGRAGDAILDLQPGSIVEATRALVGPVTPDIGPAAQRLAPPGSAKHRAGRKEHEGDTGRECAHHETRDSLVAPAHEHGAVDRIAADDLLGLEREQIPVHHRRRLLKGLRECQRRDLEREAAGRPHPSLHVLGTLAEVLVTRGDVAPRVENRDHGPADELVRRRIRAAWCGSDE